MAVHDNLRKQSKRNRCFIVLPIGESKFDLRLLARFHNRNGDVITPFDNSVAGAICPRRGPKKVLLSNTSRDSMGKGQPSSQAANKLVLFLFFQTFQGLRLQRNDLLLTCFFLTRNRFPANFHKSLTLVKPQRGRIGRIDVDLANDASHSWPRASVSLPHPL